ncbi:MAG: hypothetical protein CVU87_01185 [Firmicutes bacterium HGW-Firmicutes-12]|jgi:hypothetical protein|nr:MAG: hypothetical protein CVU87_01185 [Firmicutes bacterium HGW-Firmicutes-12]
MGCVNNCISIADHLCPPDQSLLNYFTEICLCDHLVIPSQKPDLELITNVIKNFCATDVQVIDVDLGDRDPATENIRQKIALTGTLKLGVEYSADMPEQQVHFAQYNIPFQGIIGYRPCDPLTNRGLIDDPTFDIDDYNVHICLEHEQYHQLNSREIKTVLVVLIWLELKV